MAVVRRGEAMTDHANDIDVTDKVIINWFDHEMVGLDQCACGEPAHSVLDTDRDDASECYVCGRKLYVRQITQIFEVRDAPD